jgi:hypothetical protein
MSYQNYALNCFKLSEKAFLGEVAPKGLILINASGITPEEIINFKFNWRIF